MRVAETTEVPAGSMRKVVVGGEEILIVNVGGKYYALGGKCTHRGGDLSKGVLSGSVVRCPRHGARFDVASGGVVGGPAKRSEPTFEVKVEGKNLLLRRS